MLSSASSPGFTLRAILFSSILLVSFHGCAKQRRHLHVTTANSSHTSADQRIDLNRATAKELAQLPGIGAVLAERIVAHRERYGDFRRAEHLMMVRGVSDRRFRKIRDLIKVD